MFADLHTEEHTLTFELPSRMPSSPDAQTEEIQREAATPPPAQARGGAVPGAQREAATPAPAPLRRGAVASVDLSPSSLDEEAVLAGDDDLQPAELAYNLLRRTFRGCAVDELDPVHDMPEFRQAWRGTLRNAVACHNTVLAAAASVLIDAVGRLRPGELVQAVIRVDGRTSEVWVDTARLMLLAAVARPDLDRR